MIFFCILDTNTEDMSHRIFRVLAVAGRTGGVKDTVPNAQIKLSPPSARENARIFSRQSIPGGWGEHGKAVEGELEGAQRSGPKAV